MWGNTRRARWEAIIETRLDRHLADYATVAGQIADLHTALDDLTEVVRQHHLTHDVVVSGRKTLVTLLTAAFGWILGALGIVSFFFR